MNSRSFCQENKGCYLNDLWSRLGANFSAAIFLSLAVCSLSAAFNSERTGSSSSPCKLTAWAHNSRILSSKRRAGTAVESHTGKSGGHTEFTVELLRSDV